MTLDIKTLLTNLLKKQMTIQHFSAKTKVFAPDAIPERIKNKISDEFGEDFLLDANYIVFFRGDINKEGMEKLFNLTNKAFGEDANRLVEGDFKKISFVQGSTQAAPAPQPSDADQVTNEPEDDYEEEPEDQEIEDQPEEDVEDAEDVEDIENSEDAGDIEDDNLDSGDEEDETASSDEKTMDEEIEQIINEGSISIDEDIQIDSSIDAYVFLKITTK